MLTFVWTDIGTDGRMLSSNMNPSFCNANFISAIVSWNWQKYKQKKNFTENFDINITLISKSVTLTLYQQQQQNVVNYSVVI